MLRSPRFCYTKTRSVSLILIELFLMMVPREDPFLLRLMDFRIGKNPWTDGPALESMRFFGSINLSGSDFAPISSA